MEDAEDSMKNQLVKYSPTNSLQKTKTMVGRGTYPSDPLQSRLLKAQEAIRVDLSVPSKAESDEYVRAEHDKNLNMYP